MGAFLGTLLGGWLAGFAAWLVIRRYCDAPAWLPQALCAAGFALAGIRADGLWLAASCLLVWWCVCLAVIDARTMRLPNALTGLGAVGMAAAGFASGRGAAALLGAALLAGLYLLVTALGGMGLGDAKLAVGLGGATALAGGQVWLLAAVGALAGTAALGLWRRAPAPHGPSMCLASLIALWGLT